MESESTNSLPIIEYIFFCAWVVFFPLFFSFWIPSLQRQLKNSPFALYMLTAMDEVCRMKISFQPDKKVNKIMWCDWQKPKVSKLFNWYRHFECVSSSLRLPLFISHFIHTANSMRNVVNLNFIVFVYAKSFYTALNSFMLELQICQHKKKVNANQMWNVKMSISHSFVFRHFVFYAWCVAWSE